MGIIRKYLERKTKREIRLEEIREKKERLWDIIVPYKIQSSNNDYFSKKEVIESRRRLDELEREERNLTEGQLHYFYRKVTSLF